MSYSAMRRKRFTAGVLAGAMALTVMPIIGFTGTAGALEEPTGEGSVCENPPEEEPFTDVSDADPSQAEIECLVNTGITTGVTATTYEPNSPVTRRQMALFLVRLADAIEAAAIDGQITPLPDGDGETDFTDVGDEAEEIQAAIDRLADSDIAQGVTPTTFVPQSNVTRRQMAKFIIRLQEFMAGEDATPDDPEDAFDDDEGDSGEEELNILAEEGVFEGDGQGNVNPGDDISRRQMANVIVRKAQYLFENGYINQFFTDDTVNPTATDRPELVSATIVQTTSQGTTIRFTFDEPLTGTTLSSPGLFHVYNFSSTGTVADDGDSGQVESGNTSSALVTFNAIDTAAAAAELSVGTVDMGAVQGLQGAADTNIIGDARLNAGGTSQLTAGMTAAPDLVSVGNFRANPAEPNETLVDFTFDEAAFRNPAVTPAYHLVNIDGVTENSTGTAIAGNGTTVHVVAFQNGNTGPASTVPIAPATIARGTVETGAVGDTAGGLTNPNPLHAADVSNSGNSETPDLVSAIAVRNQPDSDDLTPWDTIDAILFTFDEPVLDPAGPGGFQAYLNDGTELTGIAAFRSTANDTQVAAIFGEGGTLDLAVGASVVDATVQEGAGTNRDNQQDEVALANVGTGPTTVSGRTAAPDLIDVVVTERRDAFGTLIGARVTYHFDEDIFLLDSTALFIWLADGTGFQCTGGGTVGTTEDTDHTVRCDEFNNDDLGNPDVASTTQILNTAVGGVDDSAVANQGGTLAAPIDGGDRNPEGSEIAS